MKFRQICLIAACGFAVTSCGVMVPQAKLEDKASFALGLDPSQFTIYDKRRQGVTATGFMVRTNDGRHVYRCYVSGAALIDTSDALCTEMKGAADADEDEAPAAGKGKSARNNQRNKSATPRRSEPTPHCNELLRAAGRC